MKVTLTAAEQKDIARLRAEDREVYVRSRESGAGHRFALMCALQQAPASRTDSDYFRAHQPLAKQFTGAQGEADLKFRLAQAKRKGYRVNPHSHYDPALAMEPGDPRAWIGPAEGRGKVQATIEAQRIAAEKKREQLAKQKPGKKLAPDIVRRIAREKIRKNPDLARKGRAELTEMIIDQHGRES